MLGCELLTVDQTQSSQLGMARLGRRPLVAHIYRGRSRGALGISARRGPWHGRWRIQWT